MYYIGVSKVRQFNNEKGYTMNKKRYHVSGYDNNGNEIYSCKFNTYLAAIDCYTRCVRYIYRGSAKCSKVYMYDMHHPGDNLFLVAKYDKDFH